MMLISGNTPSSTFAVFVRLSGRQSAFLRRSGKIPGGPKLSFAGPKHSASYSSLLRLPSIHRPFATSSSLNFAAQQQIESDQKPEDPKNSNPTTEEVKRMPTDGGGEEEGEDESMLAREHFATVPNLLSMLRIAATPLLGYLVVHEQFWPACILFTLTGITDLLDGLIARHFPSQRSLFGSILDPLADKLLIGTLFITLTYMQLISVPVTVIVFGRDLILISAYVYLRLKMLEPPVTIRRFFDSTVSAVQVHPTMLSKFNTVLQLALVSLSLASPCFDFAGHPGLLFLQLFTASTTICSGLQYAFHSGMLRVKFRKGRRKEKF